MNRKTNKKNKTGLIFGTLLLSLFIVFLPTTSAGIINVPPIINVTYPKQEDDIIPNSGGLDIPLSTIATLTGRWAKFIERFSLLGNKVLQIELKIVEIPDWCEASISNPLAQLKIGQEEPYQSRLNVTVNENAPAFQQGVIRISATSKLIKGLLFNIAEETAEFDICFIIGYWCSVRYSTPEGTLKEIRSNETADFEIDIENFGNGPTFVKIELIDSSEKDWDAQIVSSVLLGSGGDQKTVYLKIKPPTKSDHDEIRKTFRVKFTPSYLGRPDLKGPEETISFNVQSSGYLKKESESDNIFLIILSVVIILIILVLIIVKRRYSKYAN